MARIDRAVHFTSVIPLSTGSIILTNELVNDGEHTSIKPGGVSSNAYADVEKLIELAYGILQFANAIRRENLANDLYTHGDFFISSMAGVWPFCEKDAG